MESTITATEANRSFSALLRRVRRGDRFIITSRGEPVATLTQASSPSESEVERRRKSWNAFKRRLNARPVRNLPRFTREDMHEK